MKATILRVILVIAVILLIIIALRLIKESDRGTPNTEQKGNPIAKPVSQPL